MIQAALGQRPDIKIYGTDYETPDGTCVRDYVHVTDLCNAHLLAMDRLMGGDKGRAYNLGNGSGFSVREVIETIREVSGRSLTVTESGRRPGDAGVLVAGRIARQGCIGLVAEAIPAEPNRGRRVEF